MSSNIWDKVRDEMLDVEFKIYVIQTDRFTDDKDYNTRIEILKNLEIKRKELLTTLLSIPFSKEDDGSDASSTQPSFIQN